MENVGDGGVVGCVVLHFKPCALVSWSAENSQVSVTQFQKRESTGIYQSQGLTILASAGKPKLTVGTLVILKVFNGLKLRLRIYIHLVIYSLTWIFDVHAKVRDVVIPIIFTIFNYVKALDWTNDMNPSRRLICLLAEHA